MMLASCGFVGLFVLRLIQRHGWEYVPIVLLALGGSLYFGPQAPSVSPRPHASGTGCCLVPSRASIW